MRKIKFNNLFIIKDLIGSKDLLLVQEYLKLVNWIPGIDNDPNKHCEVNNLDVSAILEKAKDLLMNEIQKDFNVSIGKEEIGTVVKYCIGWKLDPHYDQLDSLPTFAGYPSRDLSSIIYLTDNFNGGNIFFPELQAEIEPIAGSAIYFPGTQDYVHEVKELIRGERIAITNFWCIKKD